MVLQFLTEERPLNQQCAPSVPTTVDELIETLAPTGLLSTATTRRPPVRPSTVLRRALRRMPDDLLDAFASAGAEAATDPTRVGAFAALIATFAEPPVFADAEPWCETLVSLASMAVGDPVAAHLFVADLIGQRSALHCEFMLAFLDLDSSGILPDEFFDPAHLWIEAIRAGYAAPSSFAAEVAALLARHLDAIGYVVPACELVVDAIAWLRPWTVEPEMAATPEAVDAETWEADHTWVALETFGVHLLAKAGRHADAIETATRRALFERAAVHGDDALGIQRMLRTALVGAHTALGDRAAAVEAAEWLLWQAECEFGPASPEAIEASNMLVPLLVRVGQRDRAVELAVFTHEEALAAPTTHPELRATCAFHRAVTLACTGQLAAAAAAATDAADAADLTIGPMHPATVMLRTFVRTLPTES